MQLLQLFVSVGTVVRAAAVQTPVRDRSRRDRIAQERIDDVRECTVATNVDEDAAMEAALDAGAEDLRREDDVYVVTTVPNDLHAVRSALEAKKLKIDEAEIAMLPKNTVKVEGKDAESVLKLIEALEDLDDVQKVWANFDIDVADMAGA